MFIEVLRAGDQPNIPKSAANKGGNHNPYERRKATITIDLPTSNVQYDPPHTYIESKKVRIGANGARVHIGMRGIHL